ncbi:MAG TPA: acetyl-CoA carboxylase biotin carboxyl carrier protein subunit, partial [Candidatus Faecalibacterium faecipullorum]|nr:acetyl-CoA carboxylase biotin carboxyl carrier protein subunit [Candidatus Faecalibacterium faecipullorum]
RPAPDDCPLRACGPRPLRHDGRRGAHRLRKPRPGRSVAAPKGAAGAVAVKAPMPGNILDVKVKPGDAVKAGDALVVLEAMKMENEIVAPQDGTVATIEVNKGDVVNSGDTLVTLN